MDFLTDWLEDWLRELLIGGIMGNLEGLFDTVNARVGEIAVQVGTGGVAKSSNQMIERYPCSISTNKKSSVFLFQENLLDFGVL